MASAAQPQDAGPRGIARVMPIFEWLPTYDRSWLRSDLIAGLSVWALMVPTSLGYATISGVPVQYGLYAAAFGLIAFALFTTSRQVTQGPSSSTAAVLGAGVLAVATQGSDDAVAMAAATVLTTGALFVGMYLLKMGWVSDFLSASVLTGFTFGVAANVASGELFKITGTDASGSNTWEKLWAWVTGLSDANGTTVVVGVAALILVFGLRFVSRRIPGALIAVVLGVGATVILGLGDQGVELIGEVPRGFAPPALPDPEFYAKNLPTILSTSVGLLLIGFSVTTAAVREYATKHSYRIDINQELLAQGASNIAAGVFQGIYDNGSLSKSPVNDAAGAKSQLSNLVQAALIILTLIALAPFFSDLPEAVLGAIIIEAVVMGMMDVPEMRRLASVSRFDFLMAMVALLGVMTFGILQGVVIGVVLSLVGLVMVTSKTHIPELGRKPGTHAFVDRKHHADAETVPGLVILRFDGGIFYVNAGLLEDRLRNIKVERGQAVQGVVIDMEGVDFIDIEGADQIRKVAQVGAQHGVDLYLARVKHHVFELLRRDGVVDLIEEDRIQPEVEAAVAAYLRDHPAVEPGASSGQTPPTGTSSSPPVPG